jgi:hypothetical protein
MTAADQGRFIFLGGIPVFDYMVEPSLDEVRRAVKNDLIQIGDKILLPAGTVFCCRIENHAEPLWINPMAACELQEVNDKPYYTMVFGGKHREGEGLRLCVSSRDEVFDELNRAYPEIIRSREDLTVVELSRPGRVRLGGNNRNLIEAIRVLYGSAECRAESRGIAFEHLFFFDVKNPKFKLVKEFYDRFEVAIGSLAEIHVENLLPRISYVLTLQDGERVFDRIVLSNRTNEEIIPVEHLARRYFDLEYRLRKDDNFVQTRLVINSLTNPEELRLVCRLLQTAYASEVTTFFCPTRTLFNCIDTLVENRYYSSVRERFLNSREEFLSDAVIPYIQYLILNTDELELLSGVVRRKGIDQTCSQLVRLMNRGRRGEETRGGRLLLTDGSKGVRYTERLTPKRAEIFWRKARMPEGEEFRVRFADRRIICGDDYIDELISTLGAGDTFAGIFIGLKGIGWDSGHAMRAASLGAQHFIRTRKRPQIKDIITADERHILMGTETELRDIISHHLSESGDPTRYGTITDTIITINTTQVHHPFREILDLAREIVARKLRKS